MTTLARSVNADLSALKGRLDAIRARVEAAARRSGRASGAVLLVGVVKTVAAEVVASAVALGLSDVGENRVQEAEAKIAALGRSSARWHLIGHLQRNKAGRAAQLFDRVHGVDSEGVAAALSRQAVADGRPLAVCVQVNVAGEATKFGVAPERLEELLGSVARLPGLALDGLMTIGPMAESAEEARAGFRGLRELRDRSERSLGLELPQLSMGTSADYEVAIEEGSTMVRVGTALFGPRRV